MPGFYFNIDGYDSKGDIEKFNNYVNNPEFIDFCIRKELFEGQKNSCGIGFAMEFFDLYLKKYKKKEKVERVAQYCFLTLQNFLCRKKDIDKMLLFLKKIDYLYESGEWIIESGKSENLHIHMMIKIIDPKKHKNKLNIEWNKLFDNNITDKDFYKLSQWRKSKLMPSYEQWCLEKLDYFKDETKGNHANKEDLGLRGSFAGGGVILG